MRIYSKEKYEFVKKVLDSLPYPFYVINAKDHTVMLANSAACVKDFFDGMTCYSLTHKSGEPCGTQGNLCPLEEVIRTGKTAMAEHLHYDDNGNARNMEIHCYPIFDINGNVAQAIEYSLDITERKRAESELHDSEAKNRAILEAIPDMIFMYNIEGIFIGFKASRYLEPIMPPADFIGRKVSEVLPPYLAEQIMHYSDKALQTGNAQTFTYELHIKGSPHYYEARIVAAGDNEFLSLVRDLTDDKRTVEIRRENERLALANRAKTEFLTVMSHELRTPLNAIIGFSDLLKKKNAGELNEKQQRYADNVYSSGKHLLSLIDDILDITRVESGKMEIIIDKVSVPKIINESADIIKEKAAKQNINIITQVSPDIEFVETDENRFRQILNNLIDNAVKFSKPEGGKVTITAAKERDVVKFSVSDTGIGIKQEDIGRMFHSFEQLDAGITRKYGGTGLGLAVSKKLVELLGGKIKAESVYGEGSTFTFYLPVTAEKERG